MQAIAILVLVFVLYEVMQQQKELSALSSRTSTSGQPGGSQTQLPLPSYQVVNGGGGPNQNVDSMIGSGVSVGLGEAQQALQNVGSSLSSAVPIVGAAFSIIFSSLMQASAKRAAEARNENSAVAKAVPAWDAGVIQIKAAYNAGQLTGVGAKKLLLVLRENYWAEVTPQIQPDRNGCNGGADPLTYGKNYCGGNMGAACCVGYTNLDQSLFGAGDATHKNAAGLLDAVDAAEAAPGVPQTVPVYPVFASKYGGINRPGYQVTFTKPVASTSTSFFRL